MVAKILISFLALLPSISKVMVGLRMATLAHRARRWLSKTELKFWTRVEQALLLAGRLNDSDIDSPTIRALLNSSVDSKLAACQLVGRCIILLTIKSKAIEYRGFELSEDWLSRLDSLTNHLEEHLIPELRGDEVEEFQSSIRQTYVEGLRLAENIFAYG